MSSNFKIKTKAMGPTIKKNHPTLIADTGYQFMNIKYELTNLEFQKNKML